MEFYNYYQNLVYFLKKEKNLILFFGVVFVINFLAFVQTNQKSKPLDLREKVEAEFIALEGSEEDLLKIKETTDKFKEKIKEDEEEVLKKIEEKEKPINRIPSTITKYGLVFSPPVEYKWDGFGRMVCIHDDDKPKISNKDKPVHKDMECCLDPDEFPNPYCHYPREKYGKVLDDFNRKYEKFLRRYDDGKGVD